MRIKDLSRRLERREKIYSNISGETWHRKGYHRFFEGYTEYRTEENGKRKLHRVYTANWYACELDAGKRKFLRLLYALLTSASLALFFLSGTRELASNSSVPVILLQAVSLAVQVRLAIAVVYYIANDKKLEKRIYKSSVVAIRDSAKVGAMLTGTTGAAVILFAIITDRGMFGQELISALLFAGAAAMQYAMHLIESRVPYAEVRNDSKIGPDAIDPYVIGC